MEQTEQKPLYAALTCNIVVALLLRFVVMLFPATHLLQSHLFGLLPMMLAAPVLQIPAVRRQKGFRMCVCIAVWTAVTCLFPEYLASDLYTVLTSFFLTMVFLFVTCYPMAFVAGRERMPGALHTAMAAFVFPMTVICGVGVFAALAGITIPSPGGGQYTPAYVIDHRLSTFVSSVATGSYACVTLLFCVLRLLDRPRPVVRTLYILCLPVAYVAAALSDARVPIVCASVCIGGLVWLFSLDRLPVKRAAARMAASFCIAGAVILALYFGTDFCIRGANAASAAIAARTAQTQSAAAAPDTQLPAAAPDAQQPAAAMPEAPAPQAMPPGTELTKRPLLFRISTLNGRTDVWESAIDMFRHEPYKLITGTSPVFIIRDTQPYLSKDALNPVYPHMHSLPFQTVTAFGIPGLILYAVFILYVCIHALRVFFLGAGRLTLFERGCALIPLFYAVMDVVDISLWFAPPSSFTSLWFYLAGGYAVYLSTTLIPQKQRTADISVSGMKGADA